VARRQEITGYKSTDKGLVMTDVVVIEKYEEACEALKKASEKGEGITLCNSPGNHNYLGFSFVKEMFDQAIEKYPNVECEVIFDAETDTIAAISAICEGFKIVKYTGEEMFRERIEDIAQQKGCKLITE